MGNFPTTVSGIYGDLVTFGYSFLILITIWLRYTRIMSFLKLDSQRAVRLNIVLLFLVSIEPFLFNIVRNPPANVGSSYADAASSLYALDLGSMMLILGAFNFSLTGDEKGLIPKDLVRKFKVGSAGLFFSGTFFLVTALPFFFTITISGEPLRYILWAIPLLAIVVVRSIERLSDDKRPAETAPPS